MAGTSEIALRGEKAKLMKSMSKAWQRDVTRMLKINKSRVRAEVLSRFDMGEIVHNMSTDEKKYGQSAVEKAAKMLDVREVDLWTFRRIATAFTKVELEKMLTQTFKSGGKWGYTHIAALASVTNDKKRLALKKEVVAKSLTSRELIAKIQRTLASTNRPGRAPNMPKSIAGGLAQIKSQAAKSENYIPGWDKAVFKRLREASPDTLDGELLSLLKETRTVEVKAQSAAKKLVQQLEVAITRVESVVEKRKAKQNKTTTSENGQAGDRVAAAKQAANKKKKTKIVKKKVRRKKKRVGRRPAAA